MVNVIWTGVLQALLALIQVKVVSIRARYSTVYLRDLQV